MLSRSRIHHAGAGTVQRGLSLVELMVGLAIGLLVVAGASLVASSQLSDTRRLLLETQLQQDLRAAADIITRELRRAGSWGYSNLANATVSVGGSPATENQFDTVTLTGTPATEVTYSYYRSSGVGSTGPFGFKLESDAIKYKMDAKVTSTWQELTDSKTMRVTAFTVTETAGPQVVLPCPKDCPSGGTACFPTWQVRELAVDITGQAVADPSVVRSIRAVAKLRNDLLTPSATLQVCPS